MEAVLTSVNYGKGAMAPGSCVMAPGSNGGCHEIR